MHRRRFLALAGGGVTGTVAGCLGGADGGSDGGMDEGTTAASGGDATAASTTTAGGQSIETHPAAADLAAQPRLGDLGGHVVLAFSDPSCPRCRAFERGTVPKIRSELVEPGHAAYVVRTYPVVYPWGEPATQALEATYARDEDAFWSLFEYYFANQSSFDVDNVLERTADFLDSETALDGAAVAEDARTEAYGDRVQADLDAGSAGDVGRTTPTVLLFRDGRYVTKAAGSVSYQVVATALGES